MQFRRLYFLIMTFIVGFVAGMVPSAPAQAQNQICFNEVRYCIEGRFAEYWQQNGGLPVFGFPLTPVFEQTIEGVVRKVQIFERNRFELHPENSRPYDVLLGRLGDDLLQYYGRGGPDEPKAPVKQRSGCRYFAETDHLVCDAFLDYWQSHGLEFDGKRGVSYAESLALFGFPLTEAMMETNPAGDKVLTQWFERARFELHPKLGPNVVLLGLLGRERYVPPYEFDEWSMLSCPSDKQSPPPVSGSFWGFYDLCPEYGVEEFVRGAVYGFIPGETLTVALIDRDTGAVVDQFESSVQTGDEYYPGSYVFSYSITGLELGPYAMTFTGQQSGHTAILFFWIVEENDKRGRAGA
ncbi:hypothetical protein [Chloroflexus sp.]|uniref:hypothetical protein n=1 Tax=Chloroflexus sp. TaxID=1904827 RepID=UPI002ACEAFF8|nr:hypothetical protein [Chloroflexus sp.]